ncbi:LysR family transcriptional regulator [Helicobacter sp. 13S00477-4]|uniref:winged helix-turn-helix domain-containing protein n=1 Tax=Helicobacter sp. 13S00477-4 TaxID=1905759 RepID=UPI000BA5DAB9|nr:LysR family transcriptional regulator [Helicobacter sp. 13S00477-4]PAF52527.1 hypothetical protein BKH44_01745 [Helicobacter sp. 13S00477-4]
MKFFLRFWIKKENKNFLGKGRIELLEHIKTTGSISKAAKNMKMSYKAAWDSIDSMNRLSKEHLVESNNGGKGGGGTAITPEGQRLIIAFKRLEKVMVGVESYLDNIVDLDDLEERIQILEKKLEIS